MPELKIKFDPSVVVSALKSCLPKDQATIPLHEPCFKGREWDYVKECLDTGWVSSLGSFVDRFERKLSDFTGLKRAVATVNGTAALHLALRLVGVEANDEVLIPSLSFVAPSYAATYVGATSHFIDSEESTLGPDASKLEAWLSEISEVSSGGSLNRKTGRRIKALIAVHVFGHPCDLDSISEVCARRKIELVEDAAEAIGSFYQGKHVGHWGKVAVLSFNGNKTITTGGGGALLTQDEELARLAKHLTTTAKIPHPWRYDHDQIGYNYRLPNLNAALGCAQMEALSIFLQKKRALAKRYEQVFSDVPGIRFFNEPPFSKSNFWLNAILLDRDCAAFRDSLVEMTHQAGILTRPAWTLIHQFPMFSGTPRMDLSCAEDLQARLINLPSSVSLEP